MPCKKKKKSKPTSNISSCTSSSPSTTISSDTSEIEDKQNDKNKKPKSKETGAGGVKSKLEEDKAKDKGGAPKAEKQTKDDGKERQGGRHRRFRYPETSKNTKGDNKNSPQEARVSDFEDNEEDRRNCDFDTLLTDQIRRGLTNEALKPLAGTDCDPEQFLVPATSKYVPFLEREIDPRKLYDYIVAYMTVYYDLSIGDPNPFSEARRAMDDQLWDSLAYVTPLLCRQVIREVLRKEPLVPTTRPPVLLFGDIHGNFNDIYFIEKHFVRNSKYSNYRFVFLGDYVDRGPKSVEVVLYLFTVKLLHPDRFMLLRGNHEVGKVNHKYGLSALIEYVFKDNSLGGVDIAKFIYASFNAAFNYLPVATVIMHENQRGVFCCHGGVPSQSLKEKSQRDKPWRIDQLNALSSQLKPNPLVPSKRASKPVLALNEILWNDPLPRRVRNKPKLQGKLFYRNKKRGGHCHWFTVPALVAFLEENNLRAVVRGHQYKYSKKRGFGIDCEGRLVTVFSSSNYCGTEHNVTGFVHVSTDLTLAPHELRSLDDSGTYREFNIFEVKLDAKTKKVDIVI